MEMKALVTTTADNLGVLGAYAFLRRKLTKSQVAVLMYHRVCPKRDSWSLEPESPERFEKQIEYLCRNYEILPLARLAEDIEQGNGLPQKAVVITFDDGYKDNYIYAYPILRKYHIPATIFPATGHIGTGNLFWWDKVNYVIHHSIANQLNLDELGIYSTHAALAKAHAGSLIVERLKTLSEERKLVLIEKLLTISGVDIPMDLGKELILSWDEIGEMSNHGVVFGAHTVNHPILTNLPLEQAKYEILQSKKDLEEKLGKETATFSYPNGNLSPQLADFVKGCGFNCAVSVLPNKLISSKDDIFRLGRIPILEDSSKFKVMFCGLWGDLHSAMQRRWED
ncbi:MAG: polysaccharide deacetylase family protein [Dehalococcoidia bacterium]|nr:polysaccharide deacetylase family protein [Dehalococcoidia bacterium]